MSGIDRGRLVLTRMLRDAFVLLVLLTGAGCRDRATTAKVDAGPLLAVAMVADAQTEAPPALPVASAEPTEAGAGAAPSASLVLPGAAPDPGPLGGPHRASGIMQCKSNAVAQDLALGVDEDRTLACPLAIGDRSQRPPWRGSLVVSLTKQRRAVAGVSKDDCCYAMDGSSGRSRLH